MQLWHRLTFQQRAIVVIIGFFLLASMNLLFVYFFQNETKDDARVISIWQLEKIKAQDAVSTILENNGGDIKFVKKANQQTKIYDQLISVSKTGGVIPFYKVELNSASEKEPLLLEDISRPWEEIKKSIQVLIDSPATLDTIVQRVEQVPISDTLDIYTSRVVADVRSVPNPQVENARETIIQLLPEWNAANEEYINYYLEAASDKKATVINGSLIFWILFTVLLLIVLFKIKQEFFHPLNEILKKGEMISKGNYKVKVEDKYLHELSHIGRIFNDSASTLHSATDLIKALGDGKVNETIFEDIEGASDETLTGALVSMQKQMQKLEKEEKERIWISDGLTKFADLLRSNNETIEKLSDKITHSLVKYTNSMVGGTYLLNENEPAELELIAFYALNTKKYNNKKFKIGEGLIGQTFLEEDYIYLLEIPEDYISVATGIGETSPKAILLVPLKVENEVFGVIELASLREYKDYEIDFVRKVSESIAATIQNVKTNQRTKKLLEESQDMTEQMRSQEEEMRQNMEELSATQEEMGRKEQETSARLEAINNTLSLAEYDADRKIIYANLNFALLHGYVQADLVGMSLNKLTPDDSESTYLLNSKWEQLMQGEVQKGIYKRKNNEGKLIEVESTLTPVKGSKGEIIKVIELTEEVGAICRSSNEELHEADTMLKASLEAMEITQKHIKKLKDKINKRIELLDSKVLLLETNKKGEVNYTENNTISFFQKEINSIHDISGIKEDFISNNELSGEINLNNNTIRYSMKKINDDSYLFFFMKI